MITLERLHQVLDYNRESGNFVWKVNKGKAKAGFVAGKLHHSGYKMIKVDMREYSQHRLAWFYVYGTWPKFEIDHINGNRADNRITNLREASRAENCQNIRFPLRSNKSGFLGVTFYRGRWRATIIVDGKQRWIGSFLNAEDASRAYLISKAELHPFQTIADKA